MILTYHKVDAEYPTYWYVSADSFERQLDDLAGRQFVYLDDYDPSDEALVSINFHGVYRDVLEFAIPILRDRNIPFDAFVIGDHIGGDNSFDVVEPLQSFCSLADLEKVVRDGGRLQWHTRTHRNLDDLTEEELAFELTPPKELAERFSQSFRWFAYPHSVVSERTIDHVRGLFSGAVMNKAGVPGDRFLLPSIEMNQQTRFTNSRVSIIVANYNYGRYITEAVESVMKQTTPPDEVLIIDDCSSDGSADLILDLQVRYPQIRVEINAENLGIVENFRKAVSLTTGDYIGFLGADNRMRSDYVARCSARLNADPSLGVAYTDMTIFGHRSRELATSVEAVQVAESVIDRWPVYLWSFPEPSPDRIQAIEQKNFIHGSSMYRRAAYDDIGGYQQTSGPEDANLFARMLKSGWGCSRISEPLIAYRQHSSGQANSVLSLQLSLNAWQRIAQKSKVDLVESHAELLRSKTELAESDRTASALREEVEHLQQRLQTAAADQSAIAQSVEQLRGQLEMTRSMYENSIFWRSTAPARIAVDRLKRILRR
jgi:GT2 family glycosyltransferase/peptidoglycan/xylan/chitin deacetylase (PgdA/CDA1 family)